VGEDERTAAETGGFLPPEPPGPEPELGGPVAKPPPPPPPPPPPQQQPPPPPPAQTWQQPAPTWQQPQSQHWPQQQPTWHQPAPSVPGNGHAVAGFVLSIVAAALLVLSFGLSSIVSIACASLGIVFSRKGRQNVEEGRTPKNADLARAGFIVGIVALVLTLLATAAWIAVIAAGATDG
jgi:hypothetical protein